MVRTYHHFEKWEDWKAGMYKNADRSCIDSHILSGVNLLSCPENLRIAMLSVLNNWKYSSEENMTNRSMNRQAWLGQSACCIKHGIPECVTKICWRMLTNEQQIEANKVADYVIEYWEKNIFVYI